jgi:hypothetical protein
VWGEASSSDELAGEFGNSSEGISTGNRRVFRLFRQEIGRKSVWDFFDSIGPKAKSTRVRSHVG